jgi:hypothetical protein
MRAPLHIKNWFFSATIFLGAVLNVCKVFGIFRPTFHGILLLLDFKCEKIKPTHYCRHLKHVILWCDHTCELKMYFHKVTPKIHIKYQMHIAVVSKNIFSMCRLRLNYVPRWDALFHARVQEIFNFSSIQLYVHT